MMKRVKNIVVLGDGGWGTTLAILLFYKKFRVTLWGPFEDYARYMARHRSNPRYLKGITIPGGILISSDFSCLRHADMIIAAVPSAYLRSVLEKGRDFTDSHVPVVSVVKGIEEGTFLRMTQVIRDVWGSRRPLAVLSGPTIAPEVVRGVPTTAVAASSDGLFARRVQDIFMSSAFRVYTNRDVTGVELGGSLKNIIAIACGISDGLGFGTNTKAAIVSRGLAEMARLGIALGAKQETFSGIAGLGDLVTTCFNPLSRNHSVGERIGRGETVTRVLTSMKMVAEGVLTSRAAVGLAGKHGVDLPITSQVYQVLFKHKSPLAAVKALMKREKKSE